MNFEEVSALAHAQVKQGQALESQPTAESIKALLANQDGASSRSSVTPRQLLESVALFYDISLDDLLGKNREKKLSTPRQIIMYLMREDLKMSYPAIGEELGGRDHTTAMHAHTKISNDLENDMKLRQDIQLIKQRLYVNNV